MALQSHKVEREAQASSQQVRLLTTALLEEVRASSSVGGGGREMAEPVGEAPGESPAVKLQGTLRRNSEMKSQCYAG